MCGCRFPTVTSPHFAGTLGADAQDGTDRAPRLRWRTTLSRGRDRKLSQRERSRLEGHPSEWPPCPGPDIIRLSNDQRATGVLTPLPDDTQRRTDPRRVIIVTGASAGLGKAIARSAVLAGDRVVLVARDPERLAESAAELRRLAPTIDSVLECVADVTVVADVERLKGKVIDWAGTVDVLINCIGQSDRGRASELTPDHLHGLIDVNLTSALNCVVTLLPLLRESRGSIVNIGSLASKLASRYLGGYPLAKHALAGWTQQLRLECDADGVHVGLVCPGPIRRPDGGSRYSERVAAGDLPASAGKPGGGAKLKGLDPDTVAAAVLRCIDRRLPEIILPARVRLLMMIGAAWPSLGDRLLLRFTSSKDHPTSH